MSSLLLIVAGNNYNIAVLALKYRKRKNLGEALLLRGSNHKKLGKRLSLVQPNRPIARVNCHLLPAAIHFPVNLRVAELTFHRYGNA